MLGVFELISDAGRGEPGEGNAGAHEAETPTGTRGRLAKSSSLP